MFNIGGLEMLIIGLVALLVFGPDKLPEIMRNVGKAMRTFQTETRKASDLLRSGLDDAPKGPAAPRATSGVVDTPDGVTHEPPKPISAPIPPAPEHEVRPVVREYEDT